MLLHFCKLIKVVFKRKWQKNASNFLAKLNKQMNPPSFVQKLKLIIDKYVI